MAEKWKKTKKMGKIAQNPYKNFFFFSTKQHVKKKKNLKTIKTRKEQGKH